MSLRKFLTLFTLSAICAAALVGLGHQVVLGQTGPFSLRQLAAGAQLNGEPLPASGVLPASAPDQVLTDATGQAVLAAVASPGCQVQVQPASNLVLGACARGGVPDGNAACLESGSAILRACPGFVLQTFGANVRMDSGWAAVNFDPTSARTTVLVLEGRSNVAEVFDLAGSGESAYVPVDAGQFLVTTPGTAVSSIAGLAERTALPTSDLAGANGAAGALGLTTWLNQSLTQAAVDGTTFAAAAAPPAPAAPAGTCSVQSNGLRLRYGPGTNYGVITTLPAGTVVRPVGKGAGGTWYYVQVLPNNRPGWLSASFVACNGVNAATLPPGTVMVQPTAVAPPAATPIPGGLVAATPMAGPGLPQIEFTSDRTTIRKGECTKLRWNVKNIRSVYLNGQGVTGQGTQKVCPTKSESYTLAVNLVDGSRNVREIKIKVRE